MVVVAKQVKSFAFLKHQTDQYSLTSFLKSFSGSAMGFGLPGLQRRSDVPKGCLAIYVGESEKKRFVIPVSYLNQPSMQELLSEVEQEFGFDHPMGGLTIPCSEDVFLHITSRLQKS